MGFTGMFSVETILKIIGFGVKVGEIEQLQKTILNYQISHESYLYAITLNYFWAKFTQLNAYK